MSAPPGNWEGKSTARPLLFNVLKKWEKNAKAKKWLVCGLGPEEYSRIQSCTTAKEIWDTLQVAREVTPQVKRSRGTLLYSQYENFTVKEGETIQEMYTRNKGSTKSIVAAWGETSDEDSEDEAGDEQALMDIEELDDEQEVNILYLKDKIKFLSKERLSELLLDFIDESEIINNEKEDLSRECVILKSKCKNLESRANESESKNAELKNQVLKLDASILELKTKTRNRLLMHFPGYKNITVAIKEHLDMELKHLSGILKASTSLFLRTKSAHTVVHVKGSIQIWYMDSGCSKHMTGSKNQFLSLEDLKGGNVSFGNGKKCEIIRVGMVGKTDSHSIENVYLIDGLKYNLIIVSQLCDRGKKS
ncbi:uncharacterized protein [Nicotiana sylvestris]|uniref:uncharacterized protein n=1 Tax=Nicotiana sylvestris TaxID=4096 RepID=UPI00388CC09A